MGCKGICIRYKSTGSNMGGRYKNGQKRCQVCELFIIWDKSLCPCCGNKLRVNPRKGLLKSHLRGKFYDL